MLFSVSPAVGTGIAVAVLVLIVGAVVFHLVKNKMQGKTSCSCGCQNCAMSGVCHAAKDKK